MKYKIEGHYLIINGESFMDPNYRVEEYINIENKYLGFSSISEIIEFLNESEAYYRDVTTGKVRLNNKKVYIESDGRHLNAGFRKRDYIVYNVADKNINANYVYINQRIKVYETNGKYKFCGSFGKILFEVARRNKLNLLVYVEE